MTRDSPRASTGTWVALGLLVTLLAGVYLFFISAGKGNKWPEQSSYHTLLADSFLHGQVSLQFKPPAELLRKPDPYNPINRGLWFWDSSLYHGRYYLYWGPMPAIIIAAVKIVMGRDFLVRDEHLVMAFVLIHLLLSSLLLVLTLRALFPGAPRWLWAPALVVFALANPGPYGLGRAGVYEAAIEGGQMFLMAGLLAAFLSIRGGTSRRRQLTLLGIAGCAWAAALACRISLMFAIAALLALTAFFGLRGAHRVRREAVIRVGLLGVPVGSMLFLLGLYNRVRFDSWTEFGTSYQLTGRRYEPSLDFYLPNLHAYLLRKFVHDCHFPFLSAPFHATSLTPSWVSPDIGYDPLEPTVGLLIATPYVILGLLALWAGWQALRRLRQPTGAGAEAGTDWLYLWLVGALASVALLAGLPALGMWVSTMRYLADVTSAAVLLATLGLWSLGSRWLAAPPVVRWPTRTIGVVLGLYTVVVGLLLGFQGGYYRSLPTHNPRLFGKLVAELSVCRATPAAPILPRRPSH